MDLLTRLKEYFGFISEYRINDHYEPAVDFQKQFQLPVKILKGPFKRWIISFENVNWNRVIDGSGEKLVPTYNVTPIEPTRHRLDKKLQKIADDIFTDYMAFIVENHNKLKDQVLKDSAEEYPDEEYRTDDIEEFNHPRIVHKEGSPVPTSRVRAKQKRTSPTRRNYGVLSKVQPPTNKDST